jgi:hypothetical protein
MNHKNIAEVAETTATLNTVKRSTMSKFKNCIKQVDRSKKKKKYTVKTEPVKWVRIHNLPDFVYFNHAQHVTVGGIECQTCHGPVETYEIQKQFC